MKSLLSDLARFPLTLEKVYTPNLRVGLNEGAKWSGRVAFTAASLSLYYLNDVLLLYDLYLVHLDYRSY